MDLVSRGSGGAFSFKILRKIAQRLRKIISLHLGLVVFRIHFRKMPTLIIFNVFFGLDGRMHDSQN